MRTYSRFICVICTTPDYEFVCTFFFYFYKLQTNLVNGSLYEFYKILLSVLRLYFC
jgi:hypothetical protein